MRDVDIIDHHDNTYTVKYTPVQQVATVTSNSHAFQLHLWNLWASSCGGLGGLFQRASYPLSMSTWDRASMEGCGWAGKATISLMLPLCPRWEGHRLGRPRS